MNIIGDNLPNMLKVVWKVMRTKYKILIILLPCAFIGLLLMWLTMMGSGLFGWDPLYTLYNARIPLPVVFKGDRLVLRCTSSYYRSIHPFVPSHVTHLYWDVNVFLAKTYPKKITKEDSNGRVITTPDLTVVRWYVFDLTNERVWYCSTKQEYEAALAMLGVVPNSIELLTLQEAWDKSEEELGFKFNRKTAKEYLLKEGYFKGRTLPPGASIDADRVLEVEKWEQNKNLESLDSR